jgi:hypothetical protein
MQNELDEQELKRIWLLFFYKETIALFLYQHTNNPPLSYQAVASRFDIDIAAVNGILSYGRYLFFNILSALLGKKID